VGGGFYLGKWFIPKFEEPDPQDYCFPTTGADQHVRATSNVEELRIDPEDIELNPEQIQDNACAWQVNFVTTGEYYIQTAPVMGFYITGFIRQGYYITGVEC
jgi:hypothetical protein